jgi:probable selenium-dependent hydroxylase accessory protein YqeC
MPIISFRDSLLLSGGGIVSLVGAGGKTTLLFRLAKELAAAGESVLTTTTTKILMPAAAQSTSVIIASDPNEILHRTEALGTTANHVTAAAGQDLATGKLTGFGSDAIEIFRKSGRFRWILVEADGASRRPLKAPAGHEPVIPSATGWVVAVVGLDAIGKPLTDEWVFRPERYTRLTGIPLGSPVTLESVSTALLHESGIMKGCPPEARRFVFLNKADREDRRIAGRRIAEILRTTSRGTLAGILMGCAADTEAETECFPAAGE